MINRLQCAVCGAWLPDWKKTYCSKECRDKAKRERQREIRKEHARNEPHPCPCCGRPVESLKRIYCSPECAKEMNRMRKAKYDRTQNEMPEWERKLLEESTEKVKERRTVTMTFEEILKGMKETGLNYGEYVARYDK